MDQNVFDIAVAISGSLGGWWMKTIWAEVKDLRDNALKELREVDAGAERQLADLRTLVAGQYVSREMFDRLSIAIFTKLDRIEDKLDKKADKE